MMQKINKFRKLHKRRVTYWVIMKVVVAELTNSTTKVNVLKEYKQIGNQAGHCIWQ